MISDLILYTGNIQNITSLLKLAYTPNTLIAYKNDQATFVELVGKDLLQATPVDILEYIKKLHLKNYAASTITRKIHSISKLITFLVLAGYRTDNPVNTLKSLKKNLIPKQVKRIHQFLTNDDIVAIKKLTNNKTSLLIEVLYSTGGRISEILDIKKHDIKPYDELGSKVEITGKGNKTRCLFIENTLLKRIQKIFVAESDYLIHTEKGTRSNRINEHKKIKALIKKVTGKNGHPHQLRHLYATTQIIERNQSIKAVSKYLGHSTTSITLDMYVDDELTSAEAILK